MIIVGYPGIGKSSICGSSNSVIDLESTFFNTHDGSEEWAERYAKVALDLSKQGFVVCVSSHKCVSDALFQQHNPETDLIVAVYPEPNDTIKKKWVERLKQRYYVSREHRETPHWIVEKNYRAWTHVEREYFNDVRRMSVLNFYRYVVDASEYDLMDVITNIRKTWGDMKPKEEKLDE